jgi:hypothetical protein
MNNVDHTQNQPQSGLPTIIGKNTLLPPETGNRLLALEELAKYKQWVAWDYEITEQGKKPSKVPASPHRNCPGVR